MVEQGIENPRVGGSIPSLATISFNGLRHAKRQYRTYKHADLNLSVCIA